MCLFDNLKREIKHYNYVCDALGKKLIRVCAREKYFLHISCLKKICEKINSQSYFARLFLEQKTRD